MPRLTRSLLAAACGLTSLSLAQVAPTTPVPEPATAPKGGALKLEEFVVTGVSFNWFKL